MAEIPKDKLVDYTQSEAKASEYFRAQTAIRLYERMSRNLRKGYIFRMRQVRLQGRMIEIYDRNGEAAQVLLVYTKLHRTPLKQEPVVKKRYPASA